MLRVSARSPHAVPVGTTLHQVLKYYSVGALALALDVALFQTFVRADAAPALAAALSYALAAFVHFYINRTWSFKAFDRSAASQARTYAIVLLVAWLTTIAVVAFGTEVLHLGALVSKGLAILITLPMGFLGHRYLTFGAGLRAAVRAVILRCK